jgi:hypothetical protein
MSARDLLHQIVKNALIKDGWIITHDPFTIALGIRRAYVDLGAEQLLGAEKEGTRIAVEVKSFVGASQLTDFERAIGQYTLYKSWLTRKEPERKLYLAVDNATYEEVFTDISSQVVLEDYQIKVIIVDMVQEQIVQWIR